MRGKQQVKRGAFEADPVVGWLVVVGGPGNRSVPAIFEGNNTVGRSAQNGLQSISAMMPSRAKSKPTFGTTARTASFLFVPNLAKTNVVLAQ